MRGSTFILAVALAACGCASRPASVATPDVSHDSAYGDAVAAALVFDPPVRADEPPLELGRAGREAEAFVSWDGLQTTTYYLRIDDRQNFSGHGDFGRYERRAITQTIGVSYR